MSRCCDLQISKLDWPCSTMDSIRVSEAPDPSSILGEATKKIQLCFIVFNDKSSQ